MKGASWLPAEDMVCLEVPHFAKPCAKPFAHEAVVSRARAAQVQAGDLVTSRRLCPQKLQAIMLPYLQRCFSAHGFT